MLKFDPGKLTRIEMSAWVTVLSACGQNVVEEMFVGIVLCTVKFIDAGRTAPEIRESIVGTLYDDTRLMHLGRAPRNQTIILAKAMVEQAIGASCL